LEGIVEGFTVGDVGMKRRRTRASVEIPAEYISLSSEVLDKELTSDSLFGKEGA